MRKRLEALAEKAAALEPNAYEQKQLLNKSTDYTGRFLDSIYEQKAYTRFDDSVNSILEDPIDEEPCNPDQLIYDIENRVVPPGLNPASGAHFAYIPGGGLFTSALGDYITAITNRYAGVYYSSPGAVALETRLINWMAELIGFGEEAGGYLSSGGSIANLTAVVTAREDAGLKAADYPRAVVYLSEQAHHCVDRGLAIAGMQECIKRYIPLDSHSRMLSEEVEQAIQKDKENGLIPWMVVASGGTTDTGAIDPLEEIGEIAARHKVWYHIDAAYGGFFLLTDEGKEKLKGIARADSVVLDPHKGLFLPYGSGALVVKNLEKLAGAHRYEANYMQDTKIQSGVYSPADISPELSKHFRGLRLWMPLKLHGVKAFRSALEEKLLLARYAWQKLDEMPEIEVGHEPELSVFTFRWAPANKETDLDILNEELHKRMTDKGTVFLSTTRINDEFRFRFVVLSVRSHLEQIDLFLEELSKHIRAIKNSAEI